LRDRQPEPAVRSERDVLGLRAERDARVRHRLTPLRDQDLKRTVLVASILGSSIVFLDQTIVNVALPLLSTAPGLPARDHVLVVDASVHAFRVGMGIAAALVALGGVIARIGIEKPARLPR
jgi:hypothetical protein